MQNAIISPAVKLCQTVDAMDSIIIAIPKDDKLFWCPSKVITVENNILPILIHNVPTVLSDDIVWAIKSTN
jgi:hypothetical protein